MSVFDSQVQTYMSAPALSVGANERVSEAYRLLRERRISSLAVTDGEGRPVGIITRSDLLRVGHMASRQSDRPALLSLPDVPVSAVMSAGLVWAAPEETLLDAARRMVERRVHRLYVIKNERLQGVLSTQDLARALVVSRSRTPAARYMSSPVRTIDALEPLSAAVARLAEDRVTGLIVVEGGKPVGLFSQLEALQARDEPPDTPVGDVMGYSLACLAADTPLGRVAGSVVDTRVRRVLLVEEGRMAGILTGLDFARALIGEAESVSPQVGGGSSQDGSDARGQAGKQDGGGSQ
ncbi:MAG: CBS domain-containing protein [Myxococcota bacterium]|nr:CBS domain-containing protein [Myxococcota bacterium]